MKVFLSCSSKNDLSEEYYDMLKKVIKNACLNGHRLYVGILIDKLKDFLPKYGEYITCYSLKKYEEEKKNCPNATYKLTTDSFMRTKKLCQETDCAIIFPGGTGTLSELFAFLEEYRYIEDNKKIYLVNINGFYDDLINFINKLIKNKYNELSIMDYIKVVDLNDLSQILKEGC